jgi:hypothetical protein
MAATRARAQSLIAAGVALAAILWAGGGSRPVPAPAATSTHRTAAKTHRKKPPPPPPLLTLGPGLLAGSAVGVTMPPVGLSLEYPVMAQDLGSGPCPPPALTSELERLGSPPIELAGQSQDFTAPAEAAPLAPSSWEGLSTYVLPGGFWSQLHCLLSTTRDPLTVGLNARIGLPSWAAQMAAGAQSAATNGLAFSLGNEPDLYYLPNFASLDKPFAGEEAIDVGRYLQVAGALKPELGGAAVVGPELSGPRNWQAALPHVISAIGARTVGIHAYPLSVCRTPRAATVSGLLEPSVGNSPRGLAWVVADASAAGVPAIISEANSVSCGGKSGVSDSPAAGVWAVRFVLSALRTGFREVRFHFSGDPYDPFIVRGAELVPRPLESALVALNQWLPVGSLIRTVPGVRGLQASLLVGPTGALTLVLDNEQRTSQTVELKGARAVHVAELQATRSGLATVPLTPARGLFKLTLAANTVAAVTWTP